MDRLVKQETGELKYAGKKFWVAETEEEAIAQATAEYRDSGS